MAKLPSTKVLLRAALLTIVLAAIAAGCSPKPDRSDVDPVRSADGLVVYIGIVPAALIRGHEAGTTGEMHRGPGSGAQSHHVMVAVFDAVTAARITASRVTATLRPAGGAAVTKVLEPMTINDALTYGNYFTLAADGTPNTLETRIERPQLPPTVVTYTFRHLP